MTFIADRIRIQPDGSVTEIESSEPGRTKPMSTGLVLREIVRMSQHYDPAEGEREAMALLIKLGITGEAERLQTWIRTFWAGNSPPGRIHVLTDWVGRKLP